MKVFGLRAADIVRAAKGQAAELGVRSISRNQLTRLVQGRAVPRQNTILLLVAVFRHLTGRYILAGELFMLEPAMESASGGVAQVFDSADGSRISIPVSSGKAQIWRVFVPEETEGTAGETFDTLFVEYGALLRAIAMRRYSIPPDQAEEIVQEVFIAYLQRHTYVRNVRGWLYGALRHRCIDYLRVRGREIPLEAEHDPADERSDRARDSIVRELTFAAVLSRLGDKCRDTLRGYYLGDNQRDLAEKLSTTPGYVDQLISTCRRRAAEVFRSLGLRRR
jgi:RNA polymerase sigma factor (sigma-70 family)